MKTTILLFDMDGVLLHPKGYHQALQEVVAQTGSLLGFARVSLAATAIAAFEAAGATSEWDSSAICAALLLARLYEHDPQAVMPGDLSPRPQHNLPAPDFAAFAHRLGALPRTQTPLQRAEQLLLATKRLPAQAQALRHLLQQARDIRHSLTHRLFQERILGSAVFAQIYGLTPWLHTAGYLQTKDQPTLPPALRQGLLRWLRSPQHLAAVFTARPSRWPTGDHGTPEAEIGLRASGLPSLPFIAWGDLQWLAKRRGLDAQSLLKPSPVHVLAALRHAAGEARPAALEAAAALALDGRVDAFWQQFHGATIHAFEDGAAGLRSAAQATQTLADHGIHTRLHLHGIARHAVKQRALSAVGGQIAPSLAGPLAALLEAQT